MKNNPSTRIRQTLEYIYLGKFPWLSARNSIRANPSYSEICFLTILNHSEPIQNSFWNSPDESIGYEFIASQSELFRFSPIFVFEPMRIIPNQSEKRFVTRLMRNGKKSIRPNLRQLSEWIRTNSKLIFQP